MDPAARRMLFGGDVARDMDDLVRISSRLSNQEAMINSSRSGTHLIHFLMMIGGSALALNGHTAMLGASIAPAAGLAFAMSRPSYVNLVAKYARLREATFGRITPQFAPTTSTGAPQRLATFLSQLDNAAARDPALLSFRNAVATENGVGQERPDNKKKQNGVRP
jgi:hypothetical protein